MPVHHGTLDDDAFESCTYSYATKANDGLALAIKNPNNPIGPSLAVLDGNYNATAATSANSLIAIESFETSSEVPALVAMDAGQNVGASLGLISQDSDDYGFVDYTNTWWEHGLFHTTTIIATNFTGNGSGLTNIPASSLTGAITNSQITVQQFNGFNANYAEINIQNWSSAGSADLTATADNGNAVTNYFNAGINGSRYVPGTGVLGSTNDTYLLSVGRNSFYDLVGGGNNLYIVSQLTTNGTVSTNFTFTQSGNLTIAGSYTGSGSGLSSIPAAAVTNATGFWAAAPSGGGGGSGNASTNVSQYWPSPQNLTNTANVLAGNGTAITNLYAVGTARFYTPLAIGATNSFGAAYIVATNFTSMSGRTNLWTANMPAGLFTNLAIGHLEAVYAVNQVNGVEAWGQLLTNGVPAGQWTGGYVDSIRGGPFTAGCDLRATNISVSFEVSAPGASSISGTNFSLTLTMTPLQ